MEKRMQHYPPSQQSRKITNVQNVIRNNLN